MLPILEWVMFSLGGSDYTFFVTVPTTGGAMSGAGGYGARKKNLASRVKTNEPAGSGLNQCSQYKLVWSAETVG